MAAQVGRVSTQFHGHYRYTSEYEPPRADATIVPMQTMFDDKLRGARQWLLARSAQLRERARRVQDDLGRETTPLPRDASDAAIVIENDEILLAIEEASLSELKQIGRALERLDAGTYGVCEGCGGMIGAERLRVVPYATLCRDCAPDL
jgi:RNA polymerase-binding protein DksA